MTRSSTDLFGAIVLLSAFGMVSLDASGGTAPTPAAELARGAASDAEEEKRIAADGDQYCANRLRELLQVDGSLDQLAVESSLIISAPNALSADTAPVFDSIVEAVVTTMMGVGYVRDRSWFPSQAAQDGPAYCPGMMTFRHDTMPRFVILWVPESSLSGLSPEVMRTALSLIEPGDAPRHRLSVLGPYYSASAESLAQALGELSHTFCYRVASGSLQVPSKRDLLAARLARFPSEHCASEPPAFFSHAPPLNERLGAVIEFLDRGLEDSRSIAIVQESGTTYGGGQTQQDGGSPNVLIPIQYPPQISALRQAHAAQQKKRTPESALLGSSELSMPTDKLTLSAEGLPTFAPQETSLVHDLALRDVGRVLKELHIGDVIITSVLSQDIVFLAQRLKRESPDLRVVLYQMDRLFTGSAFANDLRGALVVTPYPSFIGDRAEYQTTMSRDSARSVSEVLHALITRDSPPYQRLAIGVLSSGRLWPLEVKQTGPNGATRVLAPDHEGVPTVFKSVTCLALSFGALNILLLWLLQLKRDAAARGERELDRTAAQAQASAAWFLKGQLGTTDPLVRPMHAAMVVTAQTALAALLGIQAYLWWELTYHAADDVQRWGRRAVFMSSAGLAIGCIAFALRASAGIFERLPTPVRVLEDDLPMASGIRRWGRILGLVLPLAIGTMTWLTVAGMCEQIAAHGSIFLDRVLNLTSGVSPYFVVASSLAFLYGLGTTHAGRMRVSEVTWPSERVVLAHALPRGSFIEARERELYASALLPGGVRYTIATFVSIVAPVLIVGQVRPGVYRHAHDFTLETPALSIAMVMGMVICWCGTVLAAALTVRLWRALSETLHALLSSDLGASFTKLPEPFARSVAEHLALGPHDLAEVEALKRTLHDAVRHAGGESTELGPCATAPSARMTSVMSAPSFIDAKQGADRARQLLEQGVPAEAADRLRSALAAFVAFGLTRWIKQFRFLMWLATIGTTTMLLMTSGYVFSVRKLLVTLSVLLTVSVVAAVAVVFVGLERNRVLSFIGGSEPGVAIQANLVRILGWAVLPVTIAVASYFPDTMRALIEWTMTVGGGR